MEKEEKKLSDGFKVATIVLALFLAGSLFYIYKISDDATKTEKRLKSEKEELSDELEAQKKELEEALANNSSLSEEIQAQLDQITQLQADLAKANDDNASLQKFRTEASRLRQENKKLLAQVSQLKEENTRLNVEIDSTNTVLATTKQMNDTLSSQLTTTVATASKLVVMNTKASAYKVKSSGKEVPTDKGSRADRITVCYNIPENKIAKQQEKMYYIQVIDTKNNVLGDKKTEEFGDKSLTYSTTSTFKYSNKTVTICESIDNSEGFPKGTYAVNIYDGSELVSTSSLILK